MTDTTTPEVEPVEPEAAAVEAAVPATIACEECGETLAWTEGYRLNHMTDGPRYLHTLVPVEVEA